MQKNKYERNPPRIDMMLTDTPFRPFEKIHLDIYTLENTKFLTVVDAFTKLGQAIELNSKNAVDIFHALLDYFSFYGTPLLISSDQGMEFFGHMIKELLETHKINIHFTTAHHPDSDGIIERFHSTIAEHCRILRAQSKEPIGIIMKYAIIGYNNSIHSTTKLTPLELTFGHTKLKDPLDILYDKQMYSDYLQKHKEKLALVYDKVHADISTHKNIIVEKINENTKNPFKVGQTVYEKSYKYARNKSGPKFSGPFIITKLLPGNKALIQKMEGNKSKQNVGRTVHLKNLRQPIVTGSPPSQQSAGPSSS